MEAVSIRSLAFRYASYEGECAAAPVLCDVDMDVGVGDFAVLTGVTGSGKTTLLRCIKREISPKGKQSGSIVVFEDDVSEATATPDVSFVFQGPDAQIVCDTVWRELAFGLECLGVPRQAMRRRVAEVASLFGIVEWFDSATADLSGGQKQLLNLASAIVMQPRLLLLDEPTALLDPVAKTRLIDALFHLNRDFGMTLIVATHSPESFASVANKAFRMDGGKVNVCAIGEYDRRKRTHVASSHRCASAAERHDVEDECFFDSDRGGCNGNCGCGDNSDSDGNCGCGNSKGALGKRQATASAKDTIDRHQTAVVARDVWFSYDCCSKWILRGLDMEVGEGQIVALVGPNGCGKTTLLKIVCGILKPQRGRAENRLGSSQAYVPQNPRLMFTCDTVGEELAAWLEGCEPRDAAVANAAAEFGLQGVLDRNPLDLSGGQMQMLAIAKAMATRPSILVMDEPTKGLDAESRLEVALALRRICGQGGRCDEAEGAGDGVRGIRAGVTVVFATHDLAFAACVADRMAFMFDGQIASFGTPEQFCDGNIYYRPAPDAFTALCEEAHGGICAGGIFADRADAEDAGRPCRKGEGIACAGKGRP